MPKALPSWAVRLALWGPLLVAALVVAGYVYVHQPFKRDGTELLQVPLSEEDPALDQVGQLQYLGGLDIPRMDQNIGGLSGLRWDAQSERLLAITDDARWVWITPVEEGERLTGIVDVEAGPLLSPDGVLLTGKEVGDSESLTRNADGGWLVGFERNHRILAYPRDISARPEPTGIEVEVELGALEDNSGLEAMAIGAQGQLLCAEREDEPGAISGRANCQFSRMSDGLKVPFRVSPSHDIASRGGVPTDADTLRDGTFLLVFRSYAPSTGNAAEIATFNPSAMTADIFGPQDLRTTLATLRAPLTVDNFEGIAVREEVQEDGTMRTFLYIVSDDNFSGSQRTLLMKFELVRD